VFQVVVSWLLGPSSDITVHGGFTITTRMWRQSARSWMMNEILVDKLFTTINDRTVSQQQHGVVNDTSEKKQRLLNNKHAVYSKLMCIRRTNNCSKVSHRGLSASARRLISIGQKADQHQPKGWSASANGLISISQWVFKPYRHCELLWPSVVDTFEGWLQ